MVMWTRLLFRSHHTGNRMGREIRTLGGAISMPHRRAYRCGIFPLYIIYYTYIHFPSTNPTTPFIHIYIFFAWREKNWRRGGFDRDGKGVIYYIYLFTFFLQIDCDQEISLHTRAPKHTHTPCAHKTGALTPPLVHAPNHR